MATEWCNHPTFFHESLMIHGQHFPEFLNSFRPMWQTKHSPEFHSWMDRRCTLLGTLVLCGAQVKITNKPNVSHFVKNQCRFVTRSMCLEFWCIFIYIYIILSPWMFYFGSCHLVLQLDLVIGFCYDSMTSMCFGEAVLDKAESYNLTLEGMIHEHSYHAAIGICNFQGYRNICVLLMPHYQLPTFLCGRHSWNDKIWTNEVMLMWRWCEWVSLINSNKWNLVSSVF